MCLCQMIMAPVHSIIGITHTMTVCWKKCDFFVVNAGRSNNNFNSQSGIGSAFMMACIAFTQIGLFCVLGTMVETSVCVLFARFFLCSLNNFKMSISQRNNVYQTVKSFQWYYLEQNETRIYQMFLQQTQQAQIILIGGVYKLNMQTFLSVSECREDPIEQMLTNRLVN